MLRFALSILRMVCLAALLPMATMQAQTAVPTTTILANLSGGTPPQHSTVTLAATVTAAGASPQYGSITLCDSTSLPCPMQHRVAKVQLTAAGTATFYIVPGPGARTYRASFSGYARNGQTMAASSSDSVSLTVQPTPSQSSSLTTTASGGSVFAVSLQTMGIYPPTASVAFTDLDNSGYLLKTLPLSNYVPNFAFVAPANQPPDTSLPDEGNEGSLIAHGDINQDGIPDAITSNISSNTLSVWLGNGDGTFRAGPPLPLNPGFGNGGITGTMADLNRDGHVDLVLAVKSFSADSSLVTVPGNGDGTFGQPTYLPFNAPIGLPQPIDTGDGVASVLLERTDVGQTYYGTGESLLLFRGDGNGGLNATPETWLPPGTVLKQFFLADFNGDGIDDLVTVEQTITEDLLHFTPGPLPNLNPTYTYSGGIRIGAITTGDFNEDGRTDLTFAGYVTAGNETTFLAEADGTAAGLSQPFPIPFLDISYLSQGAQLAMGSGDLNGDGHTDLVLFDYPTNTEYALLRNPIDPNPIVAYQHAYDRLLSAPAVADFDGDGAQDVLWVAYFQTSTSSDSKLLVRRSSPSFTGYDDLISPLPLGTGTHTIQATYLGDANVAASSATGSITTVKGQDALLLTAPPQIYLASPATLTTSFSQAQIQNHVPGGTVTFTVGNQTLGQVMLVNGSATLRTSALPLGAYTVRAAYSGDSYFASSTGYAGVQVLPNMNLQALPYAAVQGTPNLYLGASMQYFGPQQPTALVTFAVDGASPALTSCSPTYQSDTLGCGITWPGANLGAGPHTITVNFAGDATYAPQSSTSTLTINNAGDTMTISIPPTIATAGAPTTLLTYTIQYTGATPPNGGAGVLVDGQNALNVSCSPFGGPPRSLTCQWQYPTGSLPAGAHTITAFVLPDGFYPLTTANGVLNLQ